jgi:hypothetical protein
MGFEDGNRVVPEPTEHPPEPACVHAGILIVCNHLDRLIDAEAS